MNCEKVKAYIESQNAKFGHEFSPVDPAEIAKASKPGHKKPFAVFRNNRFLVQLFREDHGIVRITINSTEMIGWNEPLDSPQWKEGIGWDDLQAIKTAMGYGHRDAVEVYPKDDDVVCVANMRHLFVLNNDHGLSFIWRKAK